MATGHLHKHKGQALSQKMRDRDKQMGMLIRWGQAKSSENKYILYANVSNKISPSPVSLSN